MEKYDQIKHYRPRRIVDIWEPGSERPDGLTVVLGQEATLRLNETATIIWNLLDGQHTIEQIVEILSEQFKGICSEEIRSKTLLFLERSDTEKLIVMDWDPLE